MSNTPEIESTAQDVPGVDPQAAFMDYPEKRRVIRSSMRAGVLGVLCICLPPISWMCCSAAWRELKHAVMLSGDPLVLEGRGRRHLGLGLLAAIMGLIFGVWAGLVCIGLFGLLELLGVMRSFIGGGPRRFNPARTHLYFGAVFTSLARMQAAFILLGILLFGVMRGVRL